MARPTGVLTSGSARQGGADQGLLLRALSSSTPNPEENAQASGRRRDPADSVDYQVDPSHVTRGAAGLPGTGRHAIAGECRFDLCDRDNGSHVVTEWTPEK